MGAASYCDVTLIYYMYSLDHTYGTRLRIHEHSRLVAMPVKRQQFSNINTESLLKLLVNYWHKWAHMTMKISRLGGIIYCLNATQ